MGQPAFDVVELHFGGEGQAEFVPLEQPVEKGPSRRAEKTGNAGAQPGLLIKIEKMPAVEFLGQ